MVVDHVPTSSRVKDGCYNESSNNLHIMEAREITFEVPDSLLDESTEWLRCSLVGIFCGNLPNIDIVRRWISRIWKLCGKVEVSVMLNGFFLFSFSCQEDYSKIFTVCPWFLGSNSLSLQS